ncbi:MAG: PP2C family protein-serine/threonine phosphatase [Ignavibacteriaceae bacterium]|nr:PP2C family protein-serine/threonine phosphatase [Ignavibacteriaceae bacterium]
MDQRRLYKTIENLASQQFETEKDMLKYVLQQIVEIENIEITGGRIWQFEPSSGDYLLLLQTGNVDKINSDFRVKIEDYPLFDQVAKERTVLGNETNKVLRKKGIMRYSASGVGSKIKYNGKLYYEYMLALNSQNIDENLRLRLSIIATALTSQIKQMRYSKRATSLRADLNKAREVQKAILPEHEYTYNDFLMFGISDPAEIVGGDLFDYIEIGPGGDHLAIALGDAASKGVSAAAEAMYISGALRMACNFEIKITPLMRRLNTLVNKIFKDEKFASLFYGELSKDRNGLMLYANAGHNPPMFVKKDSDEITTLQPTGPVLGPSPSAKYSIDSIKFEPGDVLLIYSDGVTDAANTKFENYGEERLTKVFLKTKHLSPKEITYSIMDDVIHFSKNGKYSDDKTIVVVKRMK